MDVFERMKAHASVESVKKEFLKLLDQHHAKIAEMSAAAELNVKFGKIHAALDKWSFEDCPWLLKQKDVEGAAAVKKIEGIATSLHTYRVVFETIASDIWWASSEVQDKVKATAAELPIIQQTITDATKAMATMVHVAVLLGPEDEERKGKIAAATKYTVDVLRVATADLHPELRKRLDSNSSAAAAGDKRAAGAAKVDALAEARLRA